MSRKDGDFTFNADWGKLSGAQRRNTPYNDAFAYVDTELWFSVSLLCLQHGVLLSVQRASDGGATGVTVLDGALKGRAWAHDTDGITQLLRDLQEKYYGI